MAGPSRAGELAACGNATDTHFECHAAVTDLGTGDTYHVALHHLFLIPLPGRKLPETGSGPKGAAFVVKGFPRWGVSDQWSPVLSRGG
jgi:hypothetical protein